MRKRTLKKHEYVLLALFAFVAAFPLATSVTGASFDEQPTAFVTSGLHIPDLATDWTPAGI